MFGIKKLIDAAFVFYTTGYLEIPKAQIALQAKFNEELRIRKMKERFNYHSSREPSDMNSAEKKEFDYLWWYFKGYLKKNKDGSKR